ncbi:NAD(P)-dependent oxidoreductase [Sinomonas sp. ASV322]|uniref:NAD(P)-dependent oxidoreductase n=1 Tax=Sinomonas sp. ASV322 TaxID=3041920 RepID=UPI0027DBB33D|nr:NAD(P)-dependent oxidoreductase [Sinomonas sp. ASV322]MDQ4502288.1 NAD(P)-dependent oxidoreductase [Sinomonas sp. ASV322]
MALGSDARPTVGFVGLGLMGGPMAANLLAAGWPVKGWNRSAAAYEPFTAAGGEPVETVADLAGAETIVFMLPDLPMIEEAAAPLLEAWAAAPLAARTRVVVMSSVSPVDVKKFGADVSASSGGRAVVVDAPVSGGRIGAIEAKLAIMVGAEADDFAALSPLFGAMGRSVVHLGALGAGSLAKACNQLIVGATAAALAEAAVLAEAEGLDVAELFGVLSGGLAGSRVMDQLAPRMIALDYAPTGPAKFMLKDLGFVDAAASASHAALPLARAALALYGDLVDEGLGDLDLAAVHELARRRSGLTSTSPQKESLS